MAKSKKVAPKGKKVAKEVVKGGKKSGKKGC